MTLYRQLLIFLITLLLILFIGTWLSRFQATRTFLQDQLQSHAQDTATSLGLSISTHLAARDRAAMETMINAIFDRGYYEEIRLDDLDGKTLVVRYMKVKIQGIPAWFIDMVHLEAPSGKALVMNGWRRLGTILVRSHPGYAYKTLWESGVRTALWFGCAGVLTALIGGLLLRILLRPLKRVERQAHALCHRRYEIQEELPRTRELRRVVRAMNQMTRKIKDIFDEQAAIAQRLREMSYRDPLTGLGNRRFLETQVAARLRREVGGLKGVFLIVQLLDLHKLNREQGFEAGDTLIKRFSGLLKDLVEHLPNVTLARLTGGDFGIFLPDIEQEEGERICEEIRSLFTRLKGEGLSLDERVGLVGGVFYSGPTSLAELLAVADRSLREAAGQGINRWRMTPLSDEARRLARGRQEWRRLLIRILEEGGIVLHGQPCVLTADRSRIDHLEIFSRITDPSGSLLSAGTFLPMAESLDLIARFDQLVLETALKAPDRIDAAAHLAINISPASLLDDRFVDDLLVRIRAVDPKQTRVTIEVTEFTAVRELDRLRRLGHDLRKMGHGLALDHFGQSFAQFGYLKGLQPDYVKIDRAYTDELDSVDSEAYFFIGALCGVAHSLDIRVIAEGVETEHQFALLKELRIDAVQGFLIQRPRPLS